MLCQITQDRAIKQAIAITPAVVVWKFERQVENVRYLHT